MPLSQDDINELVGVLADYRRTLVQLNQEKDALTAVVEELKNELYARDHAKSEDELTHAYPNPEARNLAHAQQLLREHFPNVAHSE